MQLPSLNTCVHAWVQSVLSVILGGDRQWIAPVFTVTGVVVLRTLLQVGTASRFAVLAVLRCGPARLLCDALASGP
jgi:hypothetical protein